MAATKFFLAKLLAERDPEERIRIFTRAIDAGVSEDKILEEDERAAFRYVSNYFRRYSQVPSWEVLTYEVNIELPVPPDDTPAYWVDQIIKQHLLHQVHRLRGELDRAVANQSIPAALDCIRNCYQDLLANEGAERSGQLFGEIDGVIETHNIRQRGGRRFGVPTGFAYLDEVSMGVQSGDNWALVGRPEVGKSFILARMSLEDLMAEGGRPLILSMEMPKEQWARRVVALATTLSDTLIKAGMLSCFAVDRIREFQRRLQLDGKDQNYLIIGGRLDMTPADLHLMIQDFHPTSVWPDGAAFLNPSKGSRAGSIWERSLLVMREIRQISLQTMIPIVGSYHFSKSGKDKGLDGVAHTDEIAKLVSVALGVKNVSEMSEGQVIPIVSYKVLDIIKGREGEKGSIRIRYDMRRTRIEQDCVLRRAQSPLDLADVGERSLRDDTELRTEADDIFD